MIKVKRLFSVSCSLYNQIQVTIHIIIKKVSWMKERKVRRGGGTESDPKYIFRRGLRYKLLRKLSSLNLPIPYINKDDVHLMR